MKIILSGGGTLGPVVPLLAIVESYRKEHPETEFLWVGTKNGPERELVEKYNIPFTSIGSAKWRRYFSLLNILDIFKLAFAFLQSLVVLIREKPDLLISAGGFVSVPLHYAGSFLGMPEWVHQQDAQIGLANRLMFPIAKKITVALADSAQKISREVEWIGNPSREMDIVEPAVAKAKFDIPADSQVVFALGGGTGSSTINQLVLSALPQLSDNLHIIHLVGKERPKELSERAAGIFKNYHVYDFFLEEMKYAYAAADLVIARAGFSTLTELAALRKPALILPMFGTHQEENARVFAKSQGIIMLDNAVSGLKLAQIIKELLLDRAHLEQLGNNLHELLPATRPDQIISIINKLTE